VTQSLILHNWGGIQGCNKNEKRTKKAGLCGGEGTFVLGVVGGGKKVWEKRVTTWVTKTKKVISQRLLHGQKGEEEGKGQLKVPKKDWTRKGEKET